MVLNIRNARADALARELAELEGSTITEAVVGALDRAVRQIRDRKGVLETAAEVRAAHGITLTDAMRRPVPQEVWDVINDHESFDR